MMPPDPEPAIERAIEPAITSRPNPSPVQADRPKRRPVLILLATVAVIGFSATLFFGNRTLSQLRAETKAMSTAVTDLGEELAALRSDIAASEPQQVAQLPAPTDGTASVAPDTGGTTLNGLPRHVNGADDAAVGLVINTISGQEYYSGETASFSAEDGKARAWLVWAHWCPFCQQEMPLVANWVTTQAVSHPDMEVVSITTAMDPSAANPLEPYLDSGQYPFPVLLDRDGTLSGQLGVSAFPFWVFTAPNGAVLGRTAGLLPEERLAEIFAQLQQLGAEAAG